MEDAGAGSADLLYLHHLTPLNEVAARSFPDTPVLGHIHGSELLMLERIAEGAPASWTHAERLGRADLRMGRGLLADRRQLLRGTQARRPAARPRPRALRPDPERLRPRLRPARDRPPRPLAPPPRQRPAGLAAGQGARQRPLLAARDPAARGDDAPLQRPLHRGQAADAADRGLRRSPAIASTKGPRWSCSAASPGSGRESTRSRRSSASACTTSSSPAGMSRASCPTSSTPPTSSSTPPSASSSARCWSRGWPAECRRSRSTGPARRRSSKTAAPAG